MSSLHTSNPPGHEKTFDIIVNGRPRQVSQHRLTYWEVVRLVYPDAQPDVNIVYTVTYARSQGGHDGTMVDGDSVTLKDGMIFNVSKTDKS
jgi:hypothetical protein